MALVEQLPAQTYLHERGTPYELASHPAAFTAEGEARELGLLPGDVLKVLLLRANDQYVMAILPASRYLSTKRIKEETGDAHARLATEDEISIAFPHYQLGAIPPLPGLLGIKAYVDWRVLEHDTVAFADGRQTESLIVDPRKLFWGEEVIVTAITHTGSWRSEGDAPDIKDDYFSS